MPDKRKHYLEAELETLFQTDHKMWEFIQQGSLDGVWYWDLEKPDVEWMSPEMWVLFGIDPATKRHDPAEWQDLIFEDDLKVALENFEMHCADPSHPYDQIVRYRHADGSTVWVRCRGIAIRDGSGKPIRMLGAHNDITAVKAAEEAAKAALRKSKSANDELRSFAYSISHDLKAPSNTIKMLLKEIVAADRSSMSADQRELVELAQHTTDQMCRLVEDVLAYTRLIGEELKREPVAIGDAVQNVVEMLASLISEAGAEIVIEGDLPVIHGHPMQLRMLLQNLIENAIKYREVGRAPIITISGVGSKSTIGFSVSDNGPGIAAEFQERIFGMFKRLHRADEIGGAGLGLTLCRRVALNHGGDIHVTSESGEGAKFTVSFPGDQA